MKYDPLAPCNPVVKVDRYFDRETKLSVLFMVSLGMIFMEVFIFALHGATIWIPILAGKTILGLFLSKKF